MATNASIKVLNAQASVKVNRVLASLKIDDKDEASRIIFEMARQAERKADTLLVDGSKFSAITQYEVAARLYAEIASKPAQN